MIRECKRHGEIEFEKNGSGKDGKQQYRCKACQKVSRDKWRAENPDKCKEYCKKAREKRYVEWVAYLSKFLDLKCQRCGYDKTFAALDFHHVGEKKFMIGKYFSYACSEENKKIVNEELEKCVILCANCHREIEVTEEELSL